MDSSEFQTTPLKVQKRRLQHFWGLNQGAFFVMKRNVVDKVPVKGPSLFKLRTHTHTHTHTHPSGPPSRHRPSPSAGFLSTGQVRATCHAELLEADIPGACDVAYTQGNSHCRAAKQQNRHKKMCFRTMSTPFRVITSLYSRAMRIGPRGASFDGVSLRSREVQKSADLTRQRNLEVLIRVCTCYMYKQDRRTYV